MWARTNMPVSILGIIVAFCTLSRVLADTCYYLSGNDYMYNSCDVPYYCCNNNRSCCRDWSGGEIVGIVLGLLFFIAIIAFVVIICYKKTRARQGVVVHPGPAHTVSTVTTVHQPLQQPGYGPPPGYGPQPGFGQPAPVYGQQTQYPPYPPPNAPVYPPP